MLLEEKAQFTYEEWFVRMKFPGHETTPIDEETGLPERWEKMKIGDVSEPILRQNTATFFKLSDKKISSSQNIDKVELEKNLINKKRNELFNLYSRSHLSKIRSSSLIEYK